MNTQTNNAAKPAMRQADAVICGGGPVGLLLAVGLANRGKKVVLAEQHPPKLHQTKGVKNAFDGRVLALSNGSRQVLEQLGIWSSLRPFTTAIEHVHVSQQGYLGLTTLHAQEVGVEALGFSVQASDLGAVLWLHAKQHANIELLCPALLNDFNEHDTHVIAEFALLAKDSAPLTVEAQVIIGADGTHSKVRQLLGLPLEEKNYAAFAMLALIETQHPPQGWAYERFTQEGPVALLPLEGHFHKAVMVVPASQIDTVKGLSDQAFINLFAQKMGERLGAFESVSERHAYPLKETYVTQMFAGRAVLMGNASHTQHPVAAQGLNLGIRDIEDYLQALHSGSAPVDLGDPALLQAYAHKRALDHEKVMGLTDSLVTVFQHSSPLLGHLRGLSLMALEHLPGLKKRFSKFAMQGKS